MSKVLFKKYKVNPDINGPIHIVKAGRIDFDKISEETLEILHSQGLLEGHITIVKSKPETATPETEK